MYSLLRALSRFGLVSRQIWIERAVIWLAAAVTGLVVVFFTFLTEHAIAFFNTLSGRFMWLPLVLCPCAGFFISWATRRFFVGAEGSGIPQVIAAIRDDLPLGQRGLFVSLKIVVGKIFLGVAGLAAGFSAGREGPSVQVGASVMYAFRRFLPHCDVKVGRYLILAGGAAGIAAAFNTPLAGVMFAIEELGKRFEEKTNGVLVSAIVLSGLISISLQGNYVYFGRLEVDSVDYKILWPLLLCALTCGLAGGVFSKILIMGSRPTSGVIWSFRKAHPYWWAAICGLVIALLGVFTNGAPHGSGYVFTQATLDGDISLAWYYAPVKFVATVFTFLSGIPGGIFAPSLAIGAGIGSNLMGMFDYTMALPVYALCMAGFLAAVTQAPLTSFIIVMEMIDGHAMVISLMAISMIASLISRMFGRPLYSALAEIQFARVTPPAVKSKKLINEK